MTKQLTISAFAHASGLTVKALRLYDEQDLLRPTRVEPTTGYRWYSTDQLQHARAIRVLRSLGLSLRAIRELLEHPTADAVARVQRRFEDQIADQQRVLAYLPRLLRLQAPVPHSVSERVLPDIHIRSVRAEVDIAHLAGFVSSSIERLFAQTGDHEEMTSGPPFSRFWRPVDEERDGQVEVCVPIDVPRGPGAVLLPGGVHAVARAEGEHARYPALLEVYEAVARYASEGDRELAGPPREVYLSSPGDAVDVVEVAWPLKVA